MTEVIAGTLTAAVLVFATMMLNKYFSTRFVASVTLVAIAFIYAGFGLNNNDLPVAVLEISMAILFSLLAMIGYSGKSSLLGLGIILHGLWDILHHRGWFVNTHVPGYWPLFCLTTDIIYGAYLLYIFKKPAISM